MNEPSALSSTVQPPRPTDGLPQILRRRAAWLFAPVRRLGWAIIAAIFWTVCVLVAFGSQDWTHLGTAILLGSEVTGGVAVLIAGLTLAGAVIGLLIGIIKGAGKMCLLLIAFIAAAFFVLWLGVSLLAWMFSHPLF